MEQRCVLCNQAISEEAISTSIDYHLWDWPEFHGLFWKDTWDDHGQRVPPESADIEVILTTIPPRTEEKSIVEWVHWQCAHAYGSGLTPDAWWEQFENNLRGRG